MKESVINELKSAYDVKGHKTVINGDTLLFLSQLKRPDKMLTQLGVVTDDNTPIKCEIPCHGCGTEVPQRHTAESIVTLIENNYPPRGYKPFAAICEHCAKVGDANSINNLVMQDLYTKLSSYIEPNTYGSKDEDLLHEFSLLMDFNSYYQRALTAELMAMEYHDFLKTRYWAIVAYKVKNHRPGYCQKCGCYGESLDCHHKTYDRHGLEHIFWESDLTPLCRDCHQVEHNEHPALRSPKPIGETIILNSQLPF